MSVDSVAIKDLKVSLTQIILGNLANSPYTSFYSAFPDI